MKYIVNHLTSSLGVTFQVNTVRSAGEIPSHQGPYLIHYGDSPVPEAFNVSSSGFLDETGIRVFEPTVFKNGNQTMLFPAPDGFDLPFDIFSAVFFLLSRYEEYLPFKADRYGRFEANQSLAFRYDFLQEPVVDQWLEIFKFSLVMKFPGLSFPGKEFRYLSTFDIDSPWAYLHKGTVRTAAGLIKKVLELDMDELRLRLAVLSKRKHDPYHVYDYIRQIEKQYGFTSLFFVLWGNYGRNDTNFALNTPSFRELMETLDSERTIGIHPSYRSYRSVSLLKKEFDSFFRLFGRKPEISRQHFLLMTFPETYRSLIRLGIREDYSMGYASCTGFRAGTSRPFRFYDLADEVETDLFIFPFVVMDVTLQQYLGLTPDKALERIENLVMKVKDVNGTFTSLWHNESLSDAGTWRGWKKVFESMVERVNRELGIDKITVK